MNVYAENPKESHQRSQTVLVVDDEVTNLEVMSDFLAQCGFEVLTARDGDDALQKAAYAHPDLILLDVMMPTLDGYETCRKLTGEIVPDTPVLFMTVLGSVEDKVRGFKAGAVDYITKPFQYEEVLARITTHLRIRDLARGLQEVNENLERRVRERTEELVHTNARLQAEIAERVRAEKIAIRTARLAAAGEIAAGVAHQINNPLTAIIAEAQILMEDLSPKSPAQRSARAIKDAAVRAGIVVQRMLNLTRDLPYDLVSTDINRSVERAVSLVRTQIEPQIARIVLSLERELPSVHASEQHLEDVWINLLLNARDALLDSSDGMIEVSTLTAPTHAAIQVIVRDNGPGIALDQQQTIFDPFVTSKLQGTGLGLSICQEIIMRHQGSIEVESAPGHGAAFIVTLPTSNDIG